MDIERDIGRQKLTIGQTCDLPARSNASTSRGVNWAFLVLGAIFVGLRVVSRTRLLNGSGFRWDDFVVVLSFAVLVVLHVSLEIATQNGLGQDAFLLSVSQITETLKVCGLAEGIIHSMLTLPPVVLHRRCAFPIRCDSLEDCNCATLPPNMDDRLHQASSADQMLGNGRRTGGYCTCVRPRIRLSMLADQLHMDIFHGRTVLLH